MAFLISDPFNRAAREVPIMSEFPSGLVSFWKFLSVSKVVVPNAIMTKYDARIKEKSTIYFNWILIKIGNK